MGLKYSVPPEIRTKIDDILQDPNYTKPPIS
jgi:hypothetical protein